MQGLDYQDCVNPRYAIFRNQLFKCNVHNKEAAIAGATGAS